MNLLKQVDKLNCIIPKKLDKDLFVLANKFLIKNNALYHKQSRSVTKFCLDD